MWRGVSWASAERAWPLLRDAVIVITALGLIVFEAVFKAEPRESLIAAYIGLFMSPVFIRSDSRSTSNGDKPAPEPER